MVSVAVLGNTIRVKYSESKKVDEEPKTTIEEIQDLMARQRKIRDVSGAETALRDLRGRE